MCIRDSHKIYAEKLQAVADGKLKRLIINMPPRHTKSEFALSLIHISEPTRQAEISYAVFCLKKKKNKQWKQSTYYY